MKILTTLMVFIIASAVQAEVYKWIDDQGNVHYGDRPQTDMAVPVQIDKAPTATSRQNESRDEMRQRVTNALEEDRLAKQKKRQEDKQARQRRQRECNWLRDKQRRMKSASGLYQLDKDGNRVFLSETARKQSERSLQEQINRVCR